MSKMVPYDPAQAKEGTRRALPVMLAELRRLQTALDEQKARTAAAEAANDDAHVVEGPVCQPVPPVAVEARILANEGAGAGAAAPLPQPPHTPERRVIVPGATFTRDEDKTRKRDEDSSGDSSDDDMIPLQRRRLSRGAPTMVTFQITMGATGRIIKTAGMSTGAPADPNVTAMLSTRFNLGAAEGFKFARKIPVDQVQHYWLAVTEAVTKFGDEKLQVKNFVLRDGAVSKPDF